MTAHLRTISTLLGPGQPEVDCDTCFHILDQCVDAAVAGADLRAAHPQMHAHLQGCPACHEEFESLFTLVSGGSR